MGHGPHKAAYDEAVNSEQIAEEDYADAQQSIADLNVEKEAWGDKQRRFQSTVAKQKHQLEMMRSDIRAKQHLVRTYQQKKLMSGETPSRITNSNYAQAKHHKVRFVM